MSSSIMAFPTYDFYTIVELINAYSAGPERLAEVISGLTEEELRERGRGPEKWSTQEIVLHVTDSEFKVLFECAKRAPNRARCFPVMTRTPGPARLPIGERTQKPARLVSVSFRSCAGRPPLFSSMPESRTGKGAGVSIRNSAR
jgi:hypothetical protein